jgi:hypothetical protein
MERSDGIMERELMRRNQGHVEKLIEKPSIFCDRVRSWISSSNSWTSRERCRLRLPGVGGIFQAVGLGLPPNMLTTTFLCSGRFPSNFLIKGVEESQTCFK